MIARLITVSAAAVAMAATSIIAATPVGGGRVSDGRVHSAARGTPRNRLLRILRQRAGRMKAVLESVAASIDGR